MKYLQQVYFKNTNLLNICIITLAVLTVYWPVYHFSFLIGWDDQWFVTNHYTESGFALNNLWAIFTDFYHGQYAPINQLYYTALYHFFGYGAGVFHISSVFVHIINCGLVYVFLKKILKILCKKNGRERTFIALIAGLLFAILPINVEPTAWVAASKVLIYATFYLSALISYQFYLEKHSPKYFYFTMLFYLMSFGAKEQAVTLPFCLLLLDYLYGRSLRESLVWLEKVPLIILSILLGLATLDSQQLDQSNFYSLWQRIPLFFYSITEYFVKCVLPLNLSYLYPFPFQKDEPVPLWMWIHVISIPLILFLLKDFLSKKWVMFCGGFFLIHIGLVSNLLSLARFSIIADRYTYISAIAICFALALVFARFASSAYRDQKLAIFLGVTYFLFLVCTSKNYVTVWKNSYTVKERLKTIIEQRPDFKTLKENVE